MRPAWMRPAWMRPPGRVRACGSILGPGGGAPHPLQTRARYGRRFGVGIVFGLLPGWHAGRPGIRLARLRCVARLVRLRRATRLAWLCRAVRLRRLRRAALLAWLRRAVRLALPV